MLMVLLHAIRTIPPACQRGTHIASLAKGGFVLFHLSGKKTVHQQGGILMADNVSPQSSRPPYISNHKRAFILAAAAIVALTGIAFAFFHMGKSSSVEAYETTAATPMAARVDQVDGDVGIAPEFNGQDQNNVDWLKATV